MHVLNILLSLYMEKLHNLWNTDGRFGIVQEFNPLNLHKVKNRRKKKNLHVQRRYPVTSRKTHTKQCLGM